MTYLFPGARGPPSAACAGGAGCLSFTAGVVRGRLERVLGMPAFGQRESHLIVCECVRVCASLEEGGDSPYGDGDPALRATWSSEAPEEIRAAGVGMIRCGSAEKLARGELGWGGPFSLPTADPGTRGLGGRGKGPSRGSSGSCRRHGGPERPSPESVSREPALAP